MEVTIIGHTKGIWKAIYDTIREEIDDVVWYSRESWFDINNIKEYDSVQSWDILIINAYWEFTKQLQFLYAMLDKYNYIIVIWSDKAFKNSSDKDRSKYHIEKQALNNAVIDLNQQWYKISIVNPWYVDTDYNKNKPVSKLSTQWVADMVMTLITNYYNWVLIESVTLKKF